MKPTPAEALILSDLRKGDVALHAADIPALYERIAAAEAKGGPNSREVDIRDRRLHVLARLAGLLDCAHQHESGVALLAETRETYADVFEDVEVFVKLHRSGPLNTPANCACPRCVAHLAGTPPDPDPGCAYCASAS